MTKNNKVKDISNNTENTHSDQHDATHPEILLHMAILPGGIAASIEWFIQTSLHVVQSKTECLQTITEKCYTWLKAVCLQGNYIYQNNC